MCRKYSIVMKVQPSEKSLSWREKRFMLGMLNSKPVLPFEVDGTDTSACGFITMKEAKNLGYDLSGLTRVVNDLLESRTPESKPKQYDLQTLCGFTTLYMM